MKEFKLIRYTSKEAQEEVIENLATLSSEREQSHYYWYDIVNPSVEEVELISQNFGWHHLVAENIQNLRKFPAIEEFDECLFFSVKMIVPNQEQTVYEHVSIVLGSNYIFTFQERAEDVFEEVRQRILQDKGRVRKKGSDYLVTRLITAIIRNYQLELDYLREKIESMETQLMQNTSDDLPSALVSIRKKTARLRRIVRMQEEAINDLEEDGSNFISAKNMTYVLHLQDQLQQLASVFDVFRDMLASLMDLHLANLSQNMNVVMKILTIVSTVFIPLTFLAGIYGMNFENMPELKIPWAYPTLMGVMFIMAISILIFMKRKRWL